MASNVRRASAADLPSLCALGEEIQASHWQAWPELFARIADQEPYWRAFVEKPDHAAIAAYEELGFAKRAHVMGKFLDSGK